MLQREAARAGDVLVAEQKSDVGVADGDALEIVVIRGHQIEEILAAVAIEDHFAVARALDDDRLVGRAARGEIIGAVERRAVGGERPVESAIDEAIVFVESGVDQNDIAGLHARRHHVGMIGFVGAHVVGGEQASEGGFLLGAFVAEGINVVDVSARGRFGLLARAHRHDAFGLSLHAVGIAEDETALVFGVRLKIEDAARKHVGSDVAEIVGAALARDSAKHLLALQAQQRERLAPSLFALLSIGDVHLSVAIVVARDSPFEAE